MQPTSVTGILIGWKQSRGRETANRNCSIIAFDAWHSSICSMAPAKSNSKPSSRSTSKKKYASKFIQEWVGDLPWISRSDRGVSRAYCRMCNSQDAIRHAATSQHQQLERARTKQLCYVGLRQSEGPRHHKADNCCRDVIHEYGCRTQFVIFASGPLPNSNADSKRVFSITMVKKIDTDSRFDLGQDTLCALLSCKINIEDNCYQFQPPAELLKSTKSATWDYVKAHPSHE